MNKFCSKCKQKKSISAFHQNRSRKDGLCCQCKECVSVTSKIYRQNNREECITRNKKW